MSKAKQTSSDKEKKGSDAVKNKTTSGGGKDANDGGKPASQLKHGKGESTGSKGTS